MKTLIKIVAYILLVYGLVGVFLLRAPVAYLAIAIAIILFMVINWNRIKSFDPKRDTSKMFGMTIIDFKEEGPKAKAESPKILACSHCGAEYSPKDYRQEAPEWLCPQCAKPLPKE
jgi:uncharacterized membrane protein YbaN (DUF454 family)